MTFLPRVLSVAALAVALLPAAAHAAGPTTTIAGPLGITSTNTPTFTFTSSVNPATFQCMLDSATVWTPCGTPTQFGPLADGTHTLHVRAKTANATESAPPVRTIFVDTVKPAVSFASGPADGALSINKTPTYGLSATDANLGPTQCRIDDDNWTECTKFYAPPPQEDGPHVIGFRATDLAGNVATVTRQVVVDTTVPVVTLDDTLATTSNPTPTFTFAAGYDGHGAYAFSCTLDGGAPQPCSGGDASGTFTAPVLANGPHSFSVTAEDAAGHLSDAAATTVTVAVPDPVTVIPTATPTPIPTVVPKTKPIAKPKPAKKKASHRHKANKKHHKHKHKRHHRRHRH